MTAAGRCPGAREDARLAEPQELLAKLQTELQQLLGVSAHHEVSETEVQGLATPRVTQTITQRQLDRT